MTGHSRTGGRKAHQRRAGVQASLLGSTDVKLPQLVQPAEHLDPGGRVGLQAQVQPVEHRPPAALRDAGCTHGACVFNTGGTGRMTKLLDFQLQVQAAARGGASLLRKRADKTACRSQTAPCTQAQTVHAPACKLRGRG